MKGYFLSIQRASSIATAVILYLMIFRSAAIIAQAAAGAVTDLQLHKFQPKASPERASPSSQGRFSPVNGMSPFAAQQVRALQQEKSARTPAQRKIDSNVLYTSRMLTGRPAASGVSNLYTGVDLDAKNNIVVDIVANVTESLLGKLADAGAQVLYVNAPLRSIRTIIPPGQIEVIAASPDVIFISPRQASYTDHYRPASDGPGQSSLHAPPGFAQRAGVVRRQLAQAMSTPGTAITWQGSVGTEGDLTHQTLEARGIYGINGAGLKIGVLSDGVTSQALSQATGDLPPTCANGVPSPCLTVLPGQAGAGDEGTAILEIVHDMAPGADLYFATAQNSITSFADNIRALQAAGCNIIVDDFFYFVETPFQDGQAPTVVSTSQGGVVSQAINDVVAAGVFYFSAAGNGGNLDAGTSGTFEGDFIPQAAAAPLPIGNVHNFGGGNGYDVITSQGLQEIGLWWADPLGASANDYDLFVLDSSGSSIVAASTNIQSGSQDPVEILESANILSSDRLVIYQNTGAADRFLHLTLFRGGLSVATSGETHGHSAASGAYTVAATPAFISAGLPTPDGPYPGPFVSTDQIERFSSDGLRHIFFNADSTPITPGNYSSTGGEILSKPDITAADGVSITGVGDFGSRFYGTSAAAPAAASVAALVLSAKPGITADEMRTALTSTAIDIMASGFDPDSGNGILMALPAIGSLGVTGSANLELAGVTATENPGDGNGVIEAGEGALLQIQLKNTSGVQSATNIEATLTSSTPGVNILQPATSAYADMAVGGGPESSLTPFQFALASNIPCGQLVNFTLTVTFGGTQTRVLDFALQTGMLTITNSIGNSPALPLQIAFSTGEQTGRINRSGAPSACGTPKPFPGTMAGTHAFDAYTFPACQAVCFQPQLDAGVAGTNLMESLYSPAFNPADIGTNYIGDPGFSTNAQIFGVDLAANTTYTVAVNDIDGSSPSGPASLSTYTLQIPTCAFDCNPYPLPIAEAANVTVSAATPGGLADAAVDAGSNDPNGGPITITQFPAGPYPQGATAVTLTATNKLGAFAQATATVTVNEPVVVVTWNPAPLITGSTLGAPQLNATANFPGTFIYTPALGSSVITPTETLQAVFTPTDTIHLSPVTRSVSLPVIVAGISPSSIDFGTVYLDSIAKRAVTVTNLGPNPIAVQNPVVSPLSLGDSKEFVAASFCPQSLAAYSSCTIQVSFVAGPYYNQQSANLSIVDSSPDSPQTIALTALTVDPVIKLSANGLSFGAQKKSTTSPAKTLKLTNAGATALSIDSLAFVGPARTDYRQTNNCPNVLADGADCTVNVTFKPGETGSRFARLIIKSNAPNSPQTIFLSGTGD